MSFIQRELDHISSALQAPCSEASYAQLYAAQQALSWAQDPDGFARPLPTIEKGLALRVTDTQEGSEDCLAHRHHSQS